MKRWLYILTVCILVGCTSKVVSYQNPKAAYSKFETYRLVNPSVDRSQLSSELSTLYDLIINEIDAEMSRRGYNKSSVTPDLTLRYQLTSSTRVESTSQRSFYYPSYNVSTRTIHEAILLLELYDANNKLVWQGSYDMDQERKEKRVTRAIENAVAKIFTTYPYRALTNTPDPSLTKLKK